MTDTAGRQKWTAGEWMISGVRSKVTTRGLRDHDSHLVGTDEMSVAFVLYDPHKHATDWANARLIAAAPRLYRALASLEPYLDAIVCYASDMGEHEPNALVFEARAALAAARGTRDE